MTDALIRSGGPKIPTLDTPRSIEWTPGQAQLIELILMWYKEFYHRLPIKTSVTPSWAVHPQWFAYSGAAGCGKTTVVKEVIRQLGIGNDYIGCAYTGKAVLQLLRNGVNARTIHKLIYDPVPVYKEDPVTHKKYLTFEFQLKDRLDRDYELIIVDEAPMVNDEIARELLSFGVPIIFIGDMNQLPPVFGKSTIMENPDWILTQIMRQNESDPIVQLSQMVLKDIPLMEGQYGKCNVIRRYYPGPQMLTDYDQILCTTNKMRASVNDFIRQELKGYRDSNPRIGDKVICRQNNWDLEVDGYYLTNGTSGIITDINRSKLANGYYLMDFHPDYFPDGVDFECLKVDAKYLRSNYKDQQNVPRLANEKFEYSYGITVHLSQGSEYDRVLFLDSWFHDAILTKKARYTAITRAKEYVDIVLASF